MIESSIVSWDVKRIRIRKYKYCLMSPIAIEPLTALTHALKNDEKNEDEKINNNMSNKL